VRFFGPEKCQTRRNALPLWGRRREAPDEGCAAHAAMDNELHRCAPSLPGRPISLARRAKSAREKGRDSGGESPLSPLESQPFFFCSEAAFSPVTPQAEASLFFKYPWFAGMGPWGLPPGSGCGRGENPREAEASDCLQTPGMHRRGRSPFDCNPQAATCASPRSNSMLLQLSICGRKMSVSGLFRPEMPFYSKLMHPSEDCLQAFDGRASTLSML